HFMYSSALLVITAKQKEDLGLKGIPLTVAIKIREKWVFFKDFENNFGVKSRSQQTGEGRLTNSDDPFDGNVHEQAPKVMWVKDTIKGDEKHLYGHITGKRPTPVVICLFISFTCILAPWKSPLKASNSCYLSRRW